MILVGLCTFKRNELLKDALDSLLDLNIPAGHDVEILIVDNDSTSAAKVIFEEYKSKFKIKLHYQVESTKGITFARNKAVEFAINTGAEFLCFFDDDAQVEQNWLVQLVDTYNQFGESIISGPQLSVFDENVPDWAKSTIYFNPRRYKTGVKLPWAATNNVMIPVNFFKKHHVGFDNNLRFSGGSDQCLFMELTAKGEVIHWCDEAIVKERVGIERANPEWIINRSYRYGTTGYYLECKSKGVLLGTASSLAKGAIYLCYGSLQFVFSRKSEYKVLEAKCHIRRGIGWFTGILGKRFQEYKSR